ncbi:MAG TPA: nickel insertion protein, partial [Tepidiformaceae bacterium]|nr:nickel insertion protein [Tepidiformaceae bacterium]
MAKDRPKRPGSAGRDGGPRRKRPGKLRPGALPGDAGRGPLSEAADLQFAREFGTAEHPGASMAPAASQRVLVFDSFSGIAGDMTIAALIDAGAPIDGIREG